jgi:hypothetical protein
MRRLRDALEKRTEIEAGRQDLHGGSAASGAIVSNVRTSRISWASQHAREVCAHRAVIIGTPKST